MPKNKNTDPFKKLLGMVQVYAERSSRLNSLLSELRDLNNEVGRLRLEMKGEVQSLIVWHAKGENPLNDAQQAQLTLLDTLFEINAADLLQAKA